jgi:hypothetical protein
MYASISAIEADLDNFSADTLACVLTVPVEVSDDTRMIEGRQPVARGDLLANRGDFGGAPIVVTVSSSICDSDYINCHLRTSAYR